MYEYSEASNPLSVQILPNIEIQLDNLPVQHPYVPRICKKQGYFFIWYGDTINDSDLIENWLKCNNEKQWVRCKDRSKIEKGVSLIYPFENYTIIGSVKIAGYMASRTSSQNRKFIKSMWTDIVTMFGHKPIICPSGSYIENLHIKINNKKIPHEAYHWKMMKQHKFKRDGQFWIRSL